MTTEELGGEEEDLGEDRARGISLIPSQNSSDPHSLPPLDVVWHCYSVLGTADTV